MAASTITRTTITNDTGTPSAPNGDGTLLNATFFNNAFYAAIDQLFAGAGSYATLTFGGKIAVEGFGTHSFSAGGTGGNILSLRNTTAGTGNYAQFLLGNDASATVGALYATSSTYTTATYIQQDSLVIEGTRSGGVSIAASHAAGDLRFYNRGGTLALTIGASQAATFTGVVGSSGFGTHSVSAGGAGNQFFSVVNTTSGATAATIVGATAGTTTAYLVARSQGYTPVSGYDLAASGNLYVGGVGGLSLVANDGNVRLYSSGVLGLTLGASQAATFTGVVLHPSGAVGAPSIAFSADVDTGFYFTVGGGSGQVISGAINGVNAFSVGRDSTSVPHYLRLLPTANGTGALSGNVIWSGRNTSGSGAPGCFAAEDLGGAAYVLWPDSTGKWHTASGVNNAPQEDGTPADTSGTVVGDQTSWHAAKTAISPHLDTVSALRRVLDTPIYDYQYKASCYQDASGQPATFTGYVGYDRNDWFLKNCGEQQEPCLNEMSIFGHHALAIQALHARIATLEARAA